MAEPPTPPSSAPFDPDDYVLSVIPRLKIPAVNAPGVAPRWYKGKAPPTSDWRHRPGTAGNTIGIRATADVAPLRVALERSYDTDAFGLLYTLYGPDGRPVDPHPRLAKSALPWLRGQGYEVRCQVIIVDLDNPKTDGQKTPWTPAARAVASAQRAASPVLRTAGWYYTRNGARIVQPLRAWLEPEPFEAALRAYLHELVRAGFVPDMKCRDWTHLFRMPRVLRLDGDVATRSDADPEMPTAAIAPPGLAALLSDLPPVDDDADVPPRPPPQRVRVERLRRTRTVELLPAPPAWDGFCDHAARALALENPVGQYREVGLCLAGMLCTSALVPRAIVPALVLRVVGGGASAHMPRADAFDPVHYEAGADTVAKFESESPVKGEVALQARWPTFARAVYDLLANGPATLVAHPPGDMAASVAEARDRQRAFVGHLARGLNALASPPGMGKSHTLREYALERLLEALAPDPGVNARTARAAGRTAVAAPTHELAIEYATELRAEIEKLLGEAAAAQLVARIFSPASLLDPATHQHVCHYHAQAHALMEGGLSMRYELCDGRHKDPCAYRDGCTAAEGSDGGAGALIQIGVHPHVKRLAKFAGARGVLVLDEPPSTIVTHQFAATDLAAAAVFDGLGPRYAAALRPLLVALGTALERDFEGPLDLEAAARVGMDAVAPEALHAAVHVVGPTDLGGDAAGLLVACAQGALDPDSLGRGPTLHRTHVARAKAQPAYAESLRAVLRTVHAVHQVAVAAALPGTTPRLWVDVRAEPPTLVVKRLDQSLVGALGREGATLVLDGSLDATRPLYEAATGGKLRELRVDAPDGAVIHRVHLPASCSRRSWFDGKTPKWDGPIANAMGRVFGWLQGTVAPAIQGGYGRARLRVALISYLPVDLALQALLDPANEAQALDAGLTAADLTAARAAWGALPWGDHDWFCGHYGAIRGVNRFAKADLDALITIGDPRPNLGDVYRDCEFLPTMDWEKRVDVLMCNEQEQAQERFRSVIRSRTGYVAHIGAMPPRYWSGKKRFAGG